MKPIGLLMREHRLIEHMVAIIDRELTRSRVSQRANAHFVDTAVDFFRTYADRTHHGKEEDILFRELTKKPLAPELKQVMDELVVEHGVARRTVGELVDAKDRWLAGDATALAALLDAMHTLVTLYPAHIDKEDKHFFYPILEYFTNEEQTAMLTEFFEFDREMIHEKYRKVVDGEQKSV